MSLLNNYKDAWKDFKEVLEDRDLAGKVIGIFKMLIFLLVCAVYILERCEVRRLLPFESINIEVPKEIASFLGKQGINLYVYIGVYFLIVRPVVKTLVIEISVNSKRDFISVWYTCEDVFEITVYGILLFRLVRDGLLCLNGNDVIIEKTICLYLIVIASSIGNFVLLLHVKNKNKRFYMNIKYTDYFDAEGKRIPEEGDVIYKNKIYKTIFCKGIWYLRDNTHAIIQENIKLEDAVNDKEGNLRVHYWGMGEMPYLEKKKR